MKQPRNLSTAQVCRATDLPSQGEGQVTDQYDDDNPRWTKTDFARARGPEAMTDAELAAFPNTKRIGRPPKEAPKIPVNLRLDADVVEHFRATGAGWQTRINTALRELIASQPPQSSGSMVADFIFRDRSAVEDRIVDDRVGGKQAVATEELALRKDIGQRTEDVRDSVRHTDVEVERAPGRPKRGVKFPVHRER